MMGCQFDNPFFLSMFNIVRWRCNFDFPMDLKRQIGALLLCLLFGWYSTPKELLHIFQHHVDTEHHATQGLSFDSAHHHCSLLKVDQSLNTLEPPVFFHFTDKSITLYAKRNWIIFGTPPLGSLFEVKKSRGPPAMVL